MNSSLTDDIEFVRQFDSLSADIYKDKFYYYLTNREIASYRELSIDEVKQHHKKAKLILRDRAAAPYCELSNRAKAAVLASEYKGNAARLVDDVLNEKVDLECLPRIGHKVAVEIRKWCLKEKGEC